MMLRKRLATIAVVLSAGVVLTASSCAPAAQAGGSAATPMPLANAVATRTPVPTPSAPVFAEPPPVVPQGMPALTVGTLKQAGEQLGITISLPSYLQAGAERDEQSVRYFVRDGRGLALVEYRVGQRGFAVQYVLEPATAFAERQGQATQVGRHMAKVHTQAKEPSDPLPVNSSVAWRSGDVTVIVQGDLPVDELLRVAESLAS